MIPSVILLADFGPSMISSTVSIFVPIAEMLHQRKPPQVASLEGCGEVGKGLAHI